MYPNLLVKFKLMSKSARKVVADKSGTSQRLDFKTNIECTVTSKWKLSNHDTTIEYYRKYTNLLIH